MRVARIDATPRPAIAGVPVVTGTGRTSHAGGSRRTVDRHGQPRRGTGLPRLPPRARSPRSRPGLTATARNRRVPGLRREEVAMLAGRLRRLLRPARAREPRRRLRRRPRGDRRRAAARRGRAPAPVRPGPRRGSRPAARSPPPAAAAVPASVQAMLDAMTGAPAVGPQRPAGHPRDERPRPRPLRAAVHRTVAREGRPANHARFAFLDPRAHDFWVDWDKAANDTVGILRTVAGRDPARQGPARPRRRAVHPQRGVPHPLGPARRAPAPRRRQADQPPGRRPPRPRCTTCCPSPRHPACRCSSTPPRPARRPPTPCSCSPAGRRPTHHGPAHNP